MNQDFVLTIQDDDTVEDLDNERTRGEMNPDFQFGDDLVPVNVSESEDSDGREDQLEAIIKRHGGLQDESFEGFSDSNSESEEEESEKAQEKEFYDTDVKPEGLKSFANMSLSRPIQKGIASAGYVEPTEIQSAVIPVALLGKDVVAGAVTGSGKTAAYMIPLLERLVYRSQTPATRVVVLVPTRELAMQVHEVGTQLGQSINNLRIGMAVGGLNLRKQEQELKSRPDIVVATPGRFIDHVRNSPSFSVEQVEVLVVDEADRMLDEGFEAELNEILSLIPSKRQTLLFSATMTSSVKDLIKLSLKKPARIMVNPSKQAAKGLIQEFVRIRQHEESRPAILISLLRKLGTKQRAIVFVTRKQTAHRLRVICGLFGIRVGELHGALTQDQRIESIQAFRKLELPVLLCTDLAARGLDIPKIDVVINYELPSTFETYLHRVGRTARAGRTGTSITLVGDTNQERQIVKSAIQSSNSSSEKQKILGRQVDWDEIASISSEMKTKEDTVEEILEEEKVAKEISAAEKDVKRGENLMKHHDEIISRPKRTWFTDNKEKNPGNKTNRFTSNHQRKKKEGGDDKWIYKKTKADRDVSKKRGAHRQILKAGAKKTKQG